MAVHIFSTGIFFIFWGLDFTSFCHVLINIRFQNDWRCRCLQARWNRRNICQVDCARGASMLHMRRLHASRVIKRTHLNSKSLYRSVTYMDRKYYTARKLRDYSVEMTIWSKRFQSSGEKKLKQIRTHVFRWKIPEILLSQISHPKSLLLDEFHQYPFLTITRLFRSVYLARHKSLDVLWKRIGITSLERTLPILVARRSEVNRYNFRRLCVWRD